MIDIDEPIVSTHDYRDHYAGLPVVYAPGPETGKDKELPDPASVAWRIEGSEWGDDVDIVIADHFNRFLERVDTTRVRAIVIGHWQDCYETDSSDIVEMLAGNASRLPALRALFLGAITPDESEISWIQQSDITPLLTAFPKLERLDVRGGSGARLTPVRHESLRMLRFESGGLGGELVRALSACDLPALERLDVWLGVENYGGDATVADLAGILSGERLPALRHLGLQNSEIQDEIAAAVAAAPIVARLESLSLSMGVLTDVGAEALLSGQPLTHLSRLDLRHHFLTGSMMTRVPALLPGLTVDLDDSELQSGEDWLYTAVNE
ncbi:STM4015 family protein [Sinosporangium siamense]|uniref:Leucine-rich repeat domain-containing protein n=1 Tax=Sinosporangium siamense TaxID=1367973 RepID=A0A919VAJ4_9ACTN|nr:STM4015 family protein [Sinosporangium siamense]GII91174.1 hypothetical protein Ssi02_14050 [Sinosporangium siamense]